jgi:hypothetical protein
MRDSVSVALKERQKCRCSLSENTLSNKDILRHHYHYDMKLKKSSIYAVKNFWKHNKWLLDVKNIFTIMHYKYKYDADKIAYIQ